MLDAFGNQVDHSTDSYLFIRNGIRSRMEGDSLYMMEMPIDSRPFLYDANFLVPCKDLIVKFPPNTKTTTPINYDVGELYFNECLNVGDIVGGVVGILVGERWKSLIGTWVRTETGYECIHSREYGILYKTFLVNLNYIDHTIVMAKMIV